MNNLTLGLDVLITIADFVLRQLIHLQNKRKIHNYTLQTAYQIKEYLLSIQLMFPLALVHSSIFLAYLFAMSVAKSFFVFPDSLVYIIFSEIATMIPAIYIVATFSIFSILIEHMKRTARFEHMTNSNDTDVYFRQFEKQIQ
uniref:Uncharacterized protein n=1 Tax=Ditylenchus dipsaci TaxID=166011 RepID=A0A915E9E6_9BILA